MPGGYGNIKPEDGKQFSKDYQPKEKWTEKKALELGEELIAWLKEEEENIFYDDFLVIENNYYEELTSYLSKKFTSFLKLMRNAKKIQKTKLIKLGTMDKLNSSIAKFVMNVEHGMVEIKEVHNKNEQEPIKIIVNSEEEKQNIEQLNDMLNEND